jgi:hypothetical protein
MIQDDFGLSLPAEDTHIEPQSIAAASETFYE